MRYRGGGGGGGRGAEDLGDAKWKAMKLGADEREMDRTRVNCDD